MAETVRELVARLASEKEALRIENARLGSEANGLKERLGMLTALHRGCAGIRAENARLQEQRNRAETILPTRVIRTEWPPNDGVMPGDPQFDALLESIRAEGRILVPLTLTLGLSVIDGNHRLSAARLLGITHVPVRFWTGVEFVS